ncbi:MAG: tryptophan--tRNA ligase [Bacillota bacterium]
MEKRRILTGDRPTGRLHLGHYVGTLANRIRLQHDYDTLIIIADIQGLTTDFEDPRRVSTAVREVALDYLAAGLDPGVATIFIQSMVPAIAELTVIYSMLTTVNALRHNPTIKSEAQQRGYTDLSYGFLGYPVSEAADITFCRAHLVPVGEDQLPHIELTRKLVRRFNQLYGQVFPVPEGLVGRAGRLVGIDGQNKMSKSLNNAIFLSDPPETVSEKVGLMVTDPQRVHKRNPGRPEVCTVYTYCDVFGFDAESVAESCRRAEVGCVQCKRKLAQEINELLTPMRARRRYYENRPDDIFEILRSGTSRARQLGEETMAMVREALSFNYFRL